MTAVNGPRGRQAGTGRLPTSYTNCPIRLARRISPEWTIYSEPKLTDTKSMTKRANIDHCDTCGGKTIGLTISVQGGTRVLSQGTRNSKGIYCRKCGTERIAAMNSNDRRYK